jgi:hypothetical protein
MTRRALLWVPLAACLQVRAQDTQDAQSQIKALVDSLAGDLSSHDEKQFLAAFDPAMKGRRELASNVHALLRDAEVQASIEITSGQMDWTLDIMAHDSSAGETKRQVKATYTTATKGGKLQIASFEPVSLFAPPHGREAWDAVSGVASDLQQSSRYADGRQEDDLPSLLGHFDRAMPGYAQFAADVKALTSAWLVEPALQLIGNEGTDDRRLLEIDFTMTLTDPQNSGSSTRKEETVKCTVEKHGKQWLIVSLTPLEFFAPPRP